MGSPTTLAGENRKIDFDRKKDNNEPGEEVKQFRVLEALQ